MLPNARLLTDTHVPDLLQRAGINFNDGFGGGNLIESNLLFNTCRESGDHGPFNSWDRQVYNWNGTVQKEWDEFRNNFVSPSRPCRRSCCRAARRTSSMRLPRLALPGVTLAKL